MPGTTDYRARLYKLSIAFEPVADAVGTSVAERQRTVVATLADTIPLVDAAGQSLTGLDPVDGGFAPTGGFPDLPQAATGHVAINSEAIVRLPDGVASPSATNTGLIYRFSARAACRGDPAAGAFIPMRNGGEFLLQQSRSGRASADAEKPRDWRQNNQGFEGMARTPDGKFLIVSCRARPARTAATRRRRGRTRASSITILPTSIIRSLVESTRVPLPLFKTTDGKTRVAAQSELLALDETHFLLLCRDSSNGYGFEHDLALPQDRHPRHRARRPISQVRNMTAPCRSLPRASSRTVWYRQH